MVNLGKMLDGRNYYIYHTFIKVAAICFISHLHETIYLNFKIALKNLATNDSKHSTRTISHNFQNSLYLNSFSHTPIFLSGDNIEFSGGGSRVSHDFEE